MIEKTPKKVRKIHYIILLNDDMGGAERVALNYAIYLSKFDENKVVICYLDKKKHNPLVLKENNVSLWYGSFGTLTMSAVELAFKIRKGGKSEQIYTTHILTNAIFSLFRKLKLINTSFLVGRESTVSSDRFMGVKKLVVNTLYGLYGQHDLIICQTDYMKKKLLNNRKTRIAKKCEVIANPINPSAFEVVQSNCEKNSKPGEITVLAVGRLIPLKNFDSLIYACSDFQKEIKRDVKLIILGGGPQLAELKLVSDKCQNISVVFHGKVTNPYKYMACADIGVISSLKEGFPNVLLEMMACGVPKIVSTLCADGVDRLEGIFISKGFSSEELKDEIMTAFSSNNSKEKYSSALSDRTVTSYYDQINNHLKEFLITEK